MRKMLLISATIVLLAACAHTSEEPNAALENSATEHVSNTASTVSETSVKEQYVKKLADTKKEVEEMRANPIDDTTFAMKQVEGEIFEIWDGLLNEVYGVLEDQLPSEEMDQLRIEQRAWIDDRDKKAKEASLKYEGGTMEQLEYVIVMNNLTEERCFELVEKYMK